MPIIYKMPLENKIVKLVDPGVERVLSPGQMYHDLNNAFSPISGYFGVIPSIITDPNQAELISNIDSFVKVCLAGIEELHQSTKGDTLIPAALEQGNCISNSINTLRLWFEVLESAVQEIPEPRKGQIYDIFKVIYSNIDRCIEILSKDVSATIDSNPVTLSLNDLVAKAARETGAAAVC